MKEYLINIGYTVSERFTVKAASLAEAEAKAVQLAEDRMEMHDCSEANYEVMGVSPDNNAHTEGCIYG